MKKKKIGLFTGLCMLFFVGLFLLLLVILYPFWKLFVWVTNFIGVKGIRNRDGELQTPVVFYEHPETKRLVVFIATIHFAEPEYFASLQQIIESLSGYKILFEGVGKLSQEEGRHLTEKERDIVMQFDYVFEMTHKIGELMSFQYQKDGLSYDSSWVNTDVRLHDLVQLFAKHDICLTKKTDDLFRDKSFRLYGRWVLGKLFSHFVPFTVLVGLLTCFKRNEKFAKKSILDERNIVAVNGINEHLAKNNVVTIWGAAHLRGIEKHLKQSGFREIRREWFTVYHPSDYGLLNFLKKEWRDA